jgi:hypothetical protein
MSLASSPTYSKFSFFRMRELNIRFRTLSAAASDFSVVSVSKVENGSGRATVTNSELFRRQAPASKSANTNINTNDRRKFISSGFID